MMHHALKLDPPKPFIYSTLWDYATPSAYGWHGGCLLFGPEVLSMADIAIASEERSKERR